ncbi:uncharacterized protein TNCV_4077042 [Trichonephila clavipes]|nr:uncharacterized protein TNCV_4077042 [Trichonephila clavipes]
MIACLKISSFEVPSLLVPGDSAYLTCLFDLGGEKLYSVKWYKNDQEFYRFFPSLNPQYMAFRAPGIHVDSVAPCQCSRHVLVFLRDCLKTSKSLFADVENDHHCAPVSKLRKANRSRTTGISTVLIDCGKLGSRSERSSENNSVRNEDRLVLPQMDFVNDQLTLTQPSLSETDSITWSALQPFTGQGCVHDIPPSDSICSNRLSTVVEFLKELKDRNRQVITPRYDNFSNDGEIAPEEEFQPPLKKIGLTVISDESDDEN